MYVRFTILRMLRHRMERNQAILYEEATIIELRIKDRFSNDSGINCGRGTEDYTVRIVNRGIMFLDIRSNVSDIYRDNNVLE